MDIICKIALTLFKNQRSLLQGIDFYDFLIFFLRRSIDKDLKKVNHPKGWGTKPLAYVPSRWSETGYGSRVARRIQYLPASLRAEFRMAKHLEEVFLCPARILFPAGSPLFSPYSLFSLSFGHFVLCLLRAILTPEGCAIEETSPMAVGRLKIQGGPFRFLNPWILYVKLP